MTDADRARLALLTPQGLELLPLVAQGLTDEQIAQRLGVSRWTVRGRLKIAMATARCANRVQLAVWAVRMGVA